MLYVNNIGERVFDNVLSPIFSRWSIIVSRFPLQLFDINPNAALSGFWIRLVRF